LTFGQQQNPPLNFLNTVPKPEEEKKEEPKPDVEKPLEEKKEEEKKSVLVLG